MCLAVYLASSSWLPSVPFIEGTSYFHVMELTEHDDSVRSQFTAPNVVYVGAHEGCGCGFQPDWDDEFRPVWDKAQRALSELVDYISQHVSGHAELYVSWEDEWHLPALHHLEMGVRELAERQDWLDQRTHVSLVAD
jgi:hypothetical protein